MAIGVFNSAVNLILNQAIDVTTEDIKAVLVNEATVPTLASFNALDDIPPGNRTVVSPNLASKTIANGVIDSADFQFPAGHAAGVNTDSIVYYVDSGVESTSYLLCMVSGDTAPFENPLVTNALAINFTHNASGIFRVSNSKVYRKALESIVSASLPIASTNYAWVLVDGDDYTLDLANHQFLSDIPAGARVATSGNITPTISGRQVQVPAATITAATGDQSEMVVLFRNTGNPSTSDLLFVENAGAAGFPFTPSGADIAISAVNINF